LIEMRLPWNVFLIRNSPIGRTVLDQLILEPASIEDRLVRPVQITVYVSLDGSKIHGIPDTLGKPAADASIIMPVHDHDPLWVEDLSPQLQGDIFLVGNPTAYREVDDGVFDVALRVIQMELHPRGYRLVGGS